ncbi:type II secretion system protein [Sulfurimonas marina]|uniref:Type II secretion system protein n=2 Tax=Sulfurimonas marina TaxID=2590551 RepID=A0A7M1AY08_9BACT|nr:type II secretion system protein [Sulfurimonas marina]
MKKTNAFTIIELVFVIVVLGILSAIALPRFASTGTQARIASGKADVMAIRSAIISERQTRLIKGDSSYINRLDNGVTANAAGKKLFDSNTTLSSTSPRLLSMPIISGEGDGHWIKTGNNTYAYKISGSSITFTYYPEDATVDGVFHPAGEFNCDHSNTVCKKLTE